MGFRDRTEAGRLLAGALEHLRGADVVVLGLPRGGVPVGYEVARALDAPLDVIVVRKVGVPGQPELAMGAVGEDGARIVNTAVVRAAGVRPDALAAAQAEAAAQVEARVKALRGDRARVPLSGRIAVVVDDGIATGATARAACRVARAQGAARVVLAVPVAPADAAGALADVADEVVFLRQPSWFDAVGRFYEDFTATTEDDVQALLERAEEFAIDVGAVRLAGRLSVPPGARGVVLFVHGSGACDNAVLELNRSVQARMRCPTRLAVIPRATHLFEEHGTRHAAAALAADWFTAHRTVPAPDRP